MSMNFDAELKSRVEEVNEIIEKYLPKEEGHQKTVMEAMNYSIHVGGKRLRPLFMKETYMLFAKDDAKVTKALEVFMTAMEMIHTFSLVHDDLPELDNDMLRRGKPTTHAKYGHGMGMLAGDALFNYAYEIVLEAFDDDIDKDRVIKALKVFTNKVGIYGMIGGQVVDVELTDKEIPADKLDFIYELKTGALIEASMMIGAILAGASDEEVDKIKSVALDIGLAFQIQDDILDVTSTDEVLGKPVNSDEKNNKTTYATLYGVEEAKEYVEKYSKRAIENIKSVGNENEFLNELIIKLISRDK